MIKNVWIVMYYDDGYGTVAGVFDNAEGADIRKRELQESAELGDYFTVICRDIEQ